MLMNNNMFGQLYYNMFPDNIIFPDTLFIYKTYSVIKIIK